MSYNDFFHELDFDGDALLSREDLYRAARYFGWHWHEAPLYALLDLLTTGKPLAQDEFVACMTRLESDPDGIYGTVLEQMQHGWLSTYVPGTRQGSEENPAMSAVMRPEITGVEGLLGDILGDRVVNGYSATLDELEISPIHVAAASAALLVIDPQRSFTSGEWLRSLGPGGEQQVMPIRLAFENCARLLQSVCRPVEVMYTRCPFPPESYGWDERLAGVIDPGQPYFIKPGNNVLQPAANGFRKWLQSRISAGMKTLVLGGCTLNSCVRVSALETIAMFRDLGLGVVVDLSISGARTGNYEASVLFGGMSPVASAIREMHGCGVRLAEKVEWI
jgi:nicotinamidase-related amidase